MAQLRDAGMLVFNGWLRLNADDQLAVLQSISEYQDRDLHGKILRKATILEKSGSIVSGPIGSRCPCCGRG